MINYPLTIPGPPLTPGPNEANLKMFDAIGEVVSPFDGSSQQQQNQDQHFELDLAWPEMTWPQFGPLAAFAAGLHGKWGSFLWGPPLATAPQGTPLGMPVIASTSFNLNVLADGLQAGIASMWVQLLTESQIESLPGAGGICSGLTHAFFLNGVPVTILTAFNGIYFPLVGHGIPAGFITFAFDHANLLGHEDAGSIAITIPGVNLSGSNQIMTSAWLPNQSGLLLPSDYFQLVAPDSTGTSRTRLYQYCNPAPLASDGGGNAILDFFPSLREVPPIGTPLVFLNAQGEFRLAENRRETPARKNKTHTFQMKCREAI